MSPRSSPDEHDSHNINRTLALLYSRRGLYTQAEPLYLRALHIYEQALGPDHPDTGVVLHNLAVLYRNQDRDAEAELLLLRALHCRPTDGCQLCASNRGEDDWRATTEGAILQGIGGAGGSAANNLQDIAFAVA
jgi:tetratricopeptide (TPR) repeat protein